MDAARRHSFAARAPALISRLSRRELLLGGLACCTPFAEEPPAPIVSCTDVPASATFLGVVPFANERETPFDMPVGDGLDGRLYTNLARLEIAAPIVETDRFYIRTRYPDRLDPSAPWKLLVAGSAVDVASLRPRSMGNVLLECSGNTIDAAFGLLSTASWSGVPLLDVLASRTAIDPNALVLVSGFDDHSQPSVRSIKGASWIFHVRDLERAGAFLATEMNGAPLPRDHGAPIRLVVPGWYGCTCIKWVDTIAIVGADEPSTGHMREFASRTMQDGIPDLAREFAPASIDHAATAVRVERWRAGTDIVHRVIGIMWGGDRPTDALALRFADGPPERVALCPSPTPKSWTWFTHVWRGKQTGLVSIRATIEDPSLRTRRLASGYYARSIFI